MASVYHSLFCRKQNNALSTLVKEAYRSLRYYNPYSASVTVLALGRLHELPYSNTVLLLTVLQSIDRYTTRELLFLFEGLSLMEISHAMLSAHILKLFTRKTVYMCEHAFLQHKAEHPSLSSNGKDYSTMQPASQISVFVPFQSCALYPVIDELSKMIILLKTYHTESTLHAFLLSLTETLETHLFTQHNTGFRCYYEKILLCQRSDYVRHARGPCSGVKELPVLLENKSGQRTNFVKQVLFLFEATASVVRSLSEPPFWLLCCLQDVSVDLTREQLLHLYTVLWDGDGIGANANALFRSKEKNHKNMVTAISSSSFVHGCFRNEPFSFVVYHTYRQLICARFMTPMSTSTFPKNTAVDSVYMRTIDPEMFPHLSAKERASLKRCVLSFVENTKQHPHSFGCEEMIDQQHTCVDVTPFYLFQLTQERILIQCIQEAAVKKGLGAVGEKEPMWESYLSCALTHIHDTSSHSEKSASLFTDVFYVVSSMLLLLHQLQKVEYKDTSATVQKLVHRTCSLLRLMVHILGRQRKFSQDQETHLLRDVSLILKGVNCLPTVAATNWTPQLKVKRQAIMDEDTTFLSWLYSHLTGNEDLLTSFVEEAALVAALVVQRWVSNLKSRNAKTENLAVRTHAAGAHRVLTEKVVEAVLLWRTAAQFADALHALMRSFTSQKSSPSPLYARVCCSQLLSLHELLCKDAGAATLSLQSPACPHVCDLVRSLMLPNVYGRAFLSLLHPKANRPDDDPHQKNLAVSFIHTLHTMTSMLSTSRETVNDVAWVEREQWLSALQDTVQTILGSTELFATVQFVRRQVDLFGVYWTASTSANAFDYANGKFVWMDAAERLLTVCFATDVYAGQDKHAPPAALLPETLGEVELLLHSVLKWHPFFRSSTNIVNRCQRIRVQRAPGKMHPWSACRTLRFVSPPSSSGLKSNTNTDTPTAILAHFIPPVKDSGLQRSGPKSRTTMLYERSLQENLALLSTLPTQQASPTNGIMTSSSLSSYSTREITKTHKTNEEISREASYRSIVEILLSAAKQATWTRSQAGHTLAHVYGLSLGWQRHLPLIERWWHSSLSLRSSSTHTSTTTVAHHTVGCFDHDERADSKDCRHPFVQMCIQLWGVRETSVMRPMVENAKDGEDALAHADMDPVHLLTWYDLLSRYCMGTKWSRWTSGSDTLTSNALMQIVTKDTGVMDAPHLLPLRAQLMRYRILASLWSNTSGPSSRTAGSSALIERTLAILTEDKHEPGDPGEEGGHFTAQKAEMADEIKTLRSFLHTHALPYCVAQLVAGGKADQSRLRLRDACDLAQTLEYVLNTVAIYAPFPEDKPDLFIALGALRHAVWACSQVPLCSAEENNAAISRSLPLAGQEKLQESSRTFLKDLLSNTTSHIRARKTTGDEEQVTTATEEEDRLFFLFSHLLREYTVGFEEITTCEDAADATSSQFVVVHMSCKLVTVVYLFTLVYTYDPMWLFYHVPTKKKHLQAVRELMLENLRQARLLLEQQRWFENETLGSALNTIEKELLSFYS